VCRRAPALRQSYFRAPLLLGRQAGFAARIFTSFCNVPLALRSHMGLAKNSYGTFGAVSFPGVPDSPLGLQGRRLPDLATTHCNSAGVRRPAQSRAARRSENPRNAWSKSSEGPNETGHLRQAQARHSTRQSGKASISGLFCSGKPLFRIILYWKILLSSAQFRLYNPKSFFTPGG